MRKVILALPFFIALSASASPERVETIRNDLEVKSAIASFEANRSQKCVAIDESNTRLSRSGKVKIEISCNQYDENGEPMANVYFLTIRGVLYGTFFAMDSLSIVGAE